MPGIGNFESMVLLGLLEHHFRNPHMIGRIGFAPGKIPFILFKPCKKFAGKQCFVKIDLFHGLKLSEKFYKFKACFFENFSPQ